MMSEQCMHGQGEGRLENVLNFVAFLLLFYRGESCHATWTRRLWRSYPAANCCIESYIKMFFFAVYV